MTAMLLGLALVTSGCAGAEASEPPIEADGAVVPIGKDRDLSSAFALILSCNKADIVFSIEEQTANPGLWQSQDGSISPQGVFTTPRCGSRFLSLGTALHVRADCTANGLSARMTVATPQEVLSALAIGFASMSECGENACKLDYPSGVQSPRLCATNEPSTVITNYLEVTMTCGKSWYPSDPPALMSCRAGVSNP